MNSDNNQIYVIFNAAGVVAALFLLSLSLWLAPVDIATKAGFGALLVERGDNLMHEVPCPLTGPFLTFRPHNGMGGGKTQRMKPAESSGVDPFRSRILPLPPVKHRDAPSNGKGPGSPGALFVSRSQTSTGRAQLVLTYSLRIFSFLAASI